MNEHIVTPAADPDEKFPPKEAGIFIGGAMRPIREHTLAVWRTRRNKWEREQKRLRERKDSRDGVDTKPPGSIGPKFMKINCSVRYRRCDLEEFLRSCRSDDPQPEGRARKYSRRLRSGD
jgi:hypothetical protein